MSTKIIFSCSEAQLLTSSNLIVQTRPTLRANRFSLEMNDFVNHAELVHFRNGVVVSVLSSEVTNRSCI